MKKTTGNKILASVLAIASFLPLTSEQAFSQTQLARKTEKTTIHCMNNGNGGYVTVARRGKYQTGAMITWNDTSYGEKYSPKNRCVAIAQRFNKALATSGFSLGKLKLTNGEFNGLPVICYTGRVDVTCNEKNILLTLKKEELGKEGEIIKQLGNFSVNGTSKPLVRGRITIDYFGERIDNAFESGNPNLIEEATPELDVKDVKVKDVDEQ